jgi:ATP-dependent Clp protease ATP-binding subunit ClpA
VTHPPAAQAGRLEAKVSISGAADADRDGGPWQLDTLRRARELARRRGHGQITMEHVALVVAEADLDVVRHWRSLGIDTDRATRELARSGPPETARFGRSFEFRNDVPDELVVTPQVAAFLRECVQLRSGAAGGPASAELAGAVLTHLSAPLPGSPAIAGGSVEPESAEEHTLSAFGRDLTQLAAMGRLDPLIGRDREIESTLRVLRRRSKRNPLLVGEPGVGKTAIVEGVAHRIAAGDIGGPLADARIVSVDLAGILAGTRYRGEFEERVQALVEESVSASRPTILFVDEFHLIVRAGAAEGGLDLGSILLAPMARGQIAIIGATTPAEFRRHLRYAGPLIRRVQVIEIEEPTGAEAISIVAGVRAAYERFHGVRIDDSAVRAAIDAARRGAGRLPDAALDLVDDACALARMRVGADDPPVLVTAAQIDEIVAGRPSPGRFAPLLRGANRLASRARPRR